MIYVLHFAILNLYKSSARFENSGSIDSGVYLEKRVFRDKSSCYEQFPSSITRYRAVNAGISNGRTRCL